jgi:lipopolysaccharide/colanic/teichoic acid biosynthesis glycosyltransferase
MSGVRSLVGLEIGRNPPSQQITEARGLAASLRRDAIFRRFLLAADIIAIAGAFLLVTRLSPRPLQLTWLSVVGLPLLLLGAKLFGLYDRDETLLRKTTLDEVPKLFHLATLCALVAWIAGGWIVVDAPMHRPEAFFLWLVVVKRGFDLLGACIGIVAISPLLAVIALAIKLDGRGPVFFRQLRVGRHGERFYMLKFRTMVPDAEALKDGLRDRNEAQEGLFKIADDPRVTRVGRFLRKSALDELPQLLNILKGEMSLVGPRPLVIEEDQRVQGWHRRRLELTPGMTGHWQILGPARVPLAEMVAIDYLYVANWSLWKDIKILLRTVPHVVGRRGL